MSLTLTSRHNVDRFGYLIPTKYGNVPMVGAVATYRPGEGRFGGAVAVEEGTTNYCTRWANGSFEDGTQGANISGWTLGYSQNVESASVVYGQGYRGLGADVTLTTKETAQTSSGQAYVEFTASASTSPGVVWTFQFKYKILSGGDKLYSETILQCYDANGQYLGNIEGSGTEYTLPDGWRLRVITGTTRENTATVRGQVRLGCRVNSTIRYLVDEIQLEQKAFATSFVAGTRAAGVLRYPQLLDKKRGTLSVWINPHVVVSWNNFFLMNLSTGRFLLFFYADGSSRWDFGPNNSGPRSPAGTIVAGQWTMHTLTWDADAGVYRYYVNGKLVGERQYVEPDSLPSTLPTVNNYGALLDELLILPYAASEEEIRAWYEADGPLPPHPDALLQWDWQAVRPATMVAL